MATATAKHELDMTNGSLFQKLLKFTWPIIFTNVLQFFFNFADMAVLGIMPSGGDMSVAAVGTTNALISLVTCLFIGLSTGAQVVLSRKIGSNDGEDAKKVVGTSVVISLISGVLLVVICIPLAKVLLRLTKCPDDLMDLATLYLIVYFTGMPAVLLYNFLSSIMRAVGDSVRPMIVLGISGIINVGLNFFFMAVFKWNVEGVALATVISQLLAGMILLVIVCKSNGFARLERKYFKIDKQAFKDIVKVGVPSGVTSALYAVSNMLIQSTVNAFGSYAVAGNAAASQIENFIYVAGCSAISIACMTAVGQNVGAGKISRARKSIIYSVLISFIICVIFGLIICLFCQPISSIFIDSAEAMKYAVIRTRVRCPFMFLCGIVEIFANSLKSVGKATQGMIVSLFGACVFRIAWVKIVCRIFNSFALLHASYPISYLLVIIVDVIIFATALKKLKEKFEKQNNDEFKEGE